MIFNKEIWDKNVSAYELVNRETGEVITQKYLLIEDAALLNRVYAAEGKPEDWREINWKKKTEG